MPALRNYTVTETREVKVSAESPEAAAVAANLAFKNEEVPLSFGRIRLEVETIRLEVDKDF